MDKSTNISHAGWVGRPAKKAAPASCVPKQARRRAHDTDHVYNATVSSNIKNVTSSIPLSQISLSQTKPLPKDDFMFGCPSCSRSFPTIRGLKIHQAHCENLMLFACNHAVKNFKMHLPYHRFFAYCQLADVTSGKVRPEKWA